LNLVVVPEKADVRRTVSFVLVDPHANERAVDPGGVHELSDRRLAGPEPALRAFLAEEGKPDDSAATYRRRKQAAAPIVVL
jgi:hypothetical protein